VIARIPHITDEEPLRRQDPEAGWAIGPIARETDTYRLSPEAASGPSVLDKTRLFH
jgi:hypothetical protein